MHKMLVNTPSLTHISLGSGLSIADDAAFDEAGSQVGTKWMQVNLAKSGIHKNPKGKVFESAAIYLPLIVTEQSEKLIQKNIYE